MTGGTLYIRAGPVCWRIGCNHSDPLVPHGRLWFGCRVTGRSLAGGIRRRGTQLWLAGHGPYEYRLFWIDGRDVEACDCGGAGTPGHTLCHCPRHGNVPPHTDVAALLGHRIHWRRPGALAHAVSTKAQQRFQQGRAMGRYGQMPQYGPVAARQPNDPAQPQGAEADADGAVLAAGLGQRPGEIRARRSAGLATPTRGLPHLYAVGLAGVG